MSSVTVGVLIAIRPPAFSGSRAAAGRFRPRQTNHQ